MSTISSFRSIENKHDVYGGKKDCMKKFCKLLAKQSIQINNFKKKEMKLLAKEQEESYENAKICHYFKEKFENELWQIKHLVKLELIVLGKIEVPYIAYVI